MVSWFQLELCGKKCQHAPRIPPEFLPRSAQVGIVGKQVAYSCNGISIPTTTEQGTSTKTLVLKYRSSVLGQIIICIDELRCCMENIQHRV